MLSYLFLFLQFLYQLLVFFDLQACFHNDTTVTCSFPLIISMFWWDVLQDPIIDEQIEENLFHMLDEETDTEYVSRLSCIIF